jgi:hypothetical protein
VIIGKLTADAAAGATSIVTDFSPAVGNSVIGLGPNLESVTTPTSTSPGSQSAAAMSVSAA